MLRGLTAPGIPNRSTRDASRPARHACVRLEQILALQRQAGNRAVARSLSAGVPAPIVVQRETDSSEADDTDHRFTESPEMLIDWDELTPQAARLPEEVLQAIFFNLVAYHYERIGRMTLPDKDTLLVAYYTWKYGGVFTRARFKTLLRMLPDQTDETSTIVQTARSGNSYSLNGGYKGASNSTSYDNVIYYRDANGNINFRVSPGTILSSYNSTEKKKLASTDIKWANPVDAASQTKMNQDLKNPREGVMPSGKKVDIPKASRAQHFAIADMLYAKTRAGTWTWHHFSPAYYMELVDMRVHAKHGHNGGVYLW